MQMTSCISLSQDSYFDVNKGNVIVFDDQMIDASKDKRIVNLFTRGSHPYMGYFSSSQSERDLYRAESISPGER